MSSVQFLEGILDNFIAYCPVCKSIQPITTAYISTHCMAPGCITCQTFYEWDNGNPMIIFPRNLGKILDRMQNVNSMTSKFPKICEQV